MCTTCGCNSGEAPHDEHEHVGPDGFVYRHAHSHAPGHEHKHEHSHGQAHQSARLVR